MVRPPSVDSNGMKKGAWNEEEDNILRAFVLRFGHSNWRLLPSLAGLARCGKSCRLRWVNYLKPGLKRGKFTKVEEDLIIKLHEQHGNKWSAIATKLPGRTDNEIKNYWNAHIKKRSKRNGAATRVMKAQMPQEEQSYDQFSGCITTDHHQEKPASNNIVSPQVLSAENPENIDALNQNVDAYMVAQAQGDLWTGPYDLTCFSQLSIDLPPFPGEEFNDFGFYQNDMSSFSDSSDGGITSWNSTAESEENFRSASFEEDTFDMVLW